jgi:alkanesulfonate monooxygenase SsuD/methylene tetrahydromethanopterin reductase-like flavin-dependent oxidoreductase (luciferase family)
VIGGAGDRTLGQVARLADACNFGAGPTGGIRTPAEAQERLAALGRRCDAVGRPVADILSTHFTTWLILRETEEGVRAKVAQYFPDGLDEQWSTLIVACTPEEAVVYYQGFVDAGIRHFVVQNLDPTDDETVTLLAERVIPALAAAPTSST